MDNPTREFYSSLIPAVKDNPPAHVADNSRLGRVCLPRSLRSGLSVPSPLSPFSMPFSAGAARLEGARSLPTRHHRWQSQGALAPRAKNPSFSSSRAPSKIRREGYRGCRGTHRLSVAVSPLESSSREPLAQKQSVLFFLDIRVRLTSRIISQG